VVAAEASEVENRFARDRAQRGQGLDRREEPPSSFLGADERGGLGERDELEEADGGASRSFDSMLRAVSI